MNTVNKDAVTADLDTLRSHIRKIDKHQSKLATCHADMAEMAAKIEKIGRPSYKDEAAVNELATLKQKLDLCEQEATDAENEIPRLRVALSECLSPIACRASRLLRPLKENRIKTISAALIPFSVSAESALQLAQSTDAAKSAQRAIERVAQNPGGGHPAIVPYTRRLIAIFEEALKKDGDLLQFLVPAVNQQGNDTKEPVTADQS